MYQRARTGQGVLNSSFDQDLSAWLVGWLASWFCGRGEHIPWLPVLAFFRFLLFSASLNIFAIFSWTARSASCSGVTKRPFIHLLDVRLARSSRDSKRSTTLSIPADAAYQSGVPLWTSTALMSRPRSIRTNATSSFFGSMVAVAAFPFRRLGSITFFNFLNRS